jgi:nucleotide-binding universal stress UspA family protein
MLWIHSLPREEKPMSKVLVATMGTEFDAQAIDEALKLLGSGHDYLILTVLQGEVPAIVGDGLGIAPVMSLPPEAWIEQQKQDHVLAEHRIRETLSGLGPEVEIRVESGDPGERICAVAVEESVDLVVVGSHDVGTLRRILGGSVSNDVAHHAPCPVLLIRHRNV